MRINSKLLDRYRLESWSKFRPKGKLRMKWIEGNFYIYPDNETLKELISNGKTNLGK